MSIYYEYLDNLPTKDGVDYRIKRDDISIYVSEMTDEGQINGVYRTHSDNLSELVTEVEGFFEQNGKRFHWTISSIDTGNLEDFLIQRGYHLVSDTYLLSFDLTKELPQTPKTNELIKVRQVDYQEMRRDDIVDLISTVFGTSNDSTLSFLEQQELAEADGYIQNLQYVAYEDDTPLGFGTLTHILGYPTGRMGGAATLKKYRGRGVYTMITRRRLEDAKNLGLGQLIIDADKNTSAPILLKYGFLILDEIKEFSPYKANPII
ncbi:MAG: hypothetical protein INQ03_13520 [Candidatus Heimdallarchaeota archaeon]|nr:hypothetical protein [Candidatus Heimdallarchaeota archaeon]